MHCKTLRKNYALNKSKTPHQKVEIKKQKNMTNEGLINHKLMY